MARNTVKLRHNKIEALKPLESGRTEEWDALVPGLKIRVGKRGKVWYVWGRAKRFSGTKEFHHKLGPYSERHLGVEEARRRAREILDDAKQGIHPTEKKERERAKQQLADEQARRAEQKQDRERFDAVTKVFIEDYAKPKKRTWKEDERILNKYFVPFWGSRVLDDLEAVEITERLREIEKSAKKAKNSSKDGGFYMANRALACLRKMYNWAVANGYANRTPITKGMSRGNEKSRSRKRDFTDEEIRAIWNACDKQRYNVAAAIRMLIVSGQRGSVVTGMKHSEIDRTGKLMTIASDEDGRSKNKLEHLIPLTDLMLEIIDNVEKVDGIDHVFCSHHRGDKPLTLGDKIKKDVVKECGFSDWTWQALRGLVVTRMRRKPLRIDRDIVNMVEGRLPSDVLAIHYDSHDYFDEKREALERWNDHLRRILNGTADGEESSKNVTKLVGHR